ncbi:PIN domain-like protein [Aulographum hederae CBS 113979]|uniref:PIN domain-like protein n=1 Tax=Aulographum hederae CBS 113979 TaxID=1176131 RepID=A0A6G1GLK1_9PEZI|nr:PIN domain-like protein [Aulographum hederae CBS 113979]
MGVTGLWTVVQPCARPIKIETLNKKRLAVDASIWIYQFLKAVRDSEGNALRNSHVVGFFRRICKLLFFGIKPVFVFDGGAPVLKRQTISGRKNRREGRREDAVRTAGKLLAVQMQRRAEEEERQRKEAVRRPQQREEEPIPENLVYVDEIGMSQKERQQRKFKKKDAYHLPELDVSLAEMGAPNDPRIMSLEELEHYAQQFNTGEDINLYDFSKIDFDSPFFVSLPASDRYNILNAARLRSRLRMGYSKDQLDSMFPDRMAFSRFQIERVAERNNLTQRLMNLNGMNDDIINSGGRVAGEKGKEYVLVRNEGAEGGWALGVVGNKDEGRIEQPIDVEKLNIPVPVDDDDEDSVDDDQFEDVPIEGLNRLPKRQPEPAIYTGNPVPRRRQGAYRAHNYFRRREARPKPSADPDSLFVEDEVEATDEDQEWEDVPIQGQEDLFGEDGEDEELQRAIEMPRQAVQLSLQPNDGSPDIDEDDDYDEIFNQSKAEEQRPFTKGSGLAIARVANNRSSKAAAKPADESDSDDDGIDLQAALAESRRSKYKSMQARPRSPLPVLTPSANSKQGPAASGGFSGPLPFESLDLGSSILGKKKMQKRTEDISGGFEREIEKPKDKPATPPPWFSGDLMENMSKQKAVEEEIRAKEKNAEMEEFEFQQHQPRLRKHDTQEVIDVDEHSQDSKEPIEIVSSDDEDVEIEDVLVVDSEIRMGDLGDKVRAEPPEPAFPDARDGSAAAPTSIAVEQREQSEEKPVEWEESDVEEIRNSAAVQKTRLLEPAGGTRKSKSPSPAVQFALGEGPTTETMDVHDLTEYDLTEPAPGVPDGALVFGESDHDDEHMYSDPEDAELFEQLAAEDEEHARFASSLNNKSQTTNVADYERDLRQLRNQQKKDRRDADEVTQTMIAECQQLLSLFGLPYITAPMEAEAQCAELVNLGLVDGIVTDDSDIFLFGGTRVYKNMFNQAKFVECYLSSDLDSEFGLNRNKLIAIAHLLGSDYTEGLPGIGPVNALEIISEFDGDLSAFKEWWEAAQLGVRSKADDTAIPFRRKFRKAQATKLFLPFGFPNPHVSEAYTHPEVDSATEHFVWGVPDLDALREFLMATVGWGREKTDEVLVPVLRDMNRREAEGTQSNITRYFDGGVGAGAFAPRVREVGGSKRLAGALGRMRDKAAGASRGEGEGGAVGAQEHCNGPVAAAAATESAKKGTKRTRTTRAKATAASKQTQAIPGNEDDDAEDDDAAYEEPRPKMAKRGGRKARAAKS